MDASTPSRGRPRSEVARASVRAATQDLLREVGYDQVTIVDIAARAKVGKQTIYRWWPSKAAIVTDCVLEGIVELSLITAPTSGAAARDLIAWLDASHATIASPDTAPLLRALTAAAATDGDAAIRMAERFTGPLRDAIKATLDEGVAAGQIRADADADAIADMLLGSLIYAIQSRDGTAATRAPAVIATILQGIATVPADVTTGASGFQFSPSSRGLHDDDALV